MKRFKKIREKILLHPMMAFLFLTGAVVILSGILDLFDASVTYNAINPKTGSYEATLVTVESLLNLSGIKYIFSHTVSNFVSFAPLSMLLIALLGIGIMDKSGFLDSLFFALTKKVPKTTVTFIYVLICILAAISGDLCFIIFIPLGALLFKYGKRNPQVGILVSFVSVAFGYGLSLTMSSIDSMLINYTELAANIISDGYTIPTSSYFIIMLVAIIAAAGVITYVTEKIMVTRLGKYEVEEEIVQDKEQLTKRELRGLIFAGFGALVYVFIFIYNIIPNVPFGGNLLDYSQERYIDMLFGYDSFFNDGYVFVITFLFFLVGLLYGVGTKVINNHRDICNFLSHSLDGIGKVIVLIFFASMFVSLLKYTNIGTLVVASLSNVIANANFGGLALVLLVFFVSLLTTFVMPSFVTRWEILSSSVVPLMMTAGYTPELSQLVFSAGSSIVYAITPAMAYFVIYVSYMEKYDKSGIGLIKSIRYCMPYVFGMLVLWVVLILVWTLVGLPLGIGTSGIL